MEDVAWPSAAFIRKSNKIRLVSVITAWYLTGFEWVSSERSLHDFKLSDYYLRWALKVFFYWSRSWPCMAESITDPNPKSKAKAKDTKGASEHVHSCLQQMASLTNLSFMRNFNLNLQEELNHCSFGFPGVTGARSQDWCTAPPKTCRPSTLANQSSRHLM